MNFTQVVPEDSRNEIKSLIEKIKRGESITSFKNRRKTKDGKLLDVWVVATVLQDESGQPVEIATTERYLAWLAKE